MFQNPDDASLKNLLTRSKTIAVAGLSGHPERDSHRVACYLREGLPRSGEPPR